MSERDEITPNSVIGASSRKACLRRPVCVRERECARERESESESAREREKERECVSLSEAGPRRAKAKCHPQTRVRCKIMMVLFESIIIRF